jgi:hypothetical protein
MTGDCPRGLHGSNELSYMTGSVNRGSRAVEEEKEEASNAELYSNAAAARMTAAAAMEKMRRQ